MNSETLDLCRQTAETVLENMFFETLIDTPSLCAEYPAESLHAEARFSGSESGTLRVAVDPAMARRLASNFLGEDESDISLLQIENTLCELTNIYCGCLLSHVRPEARLKIKSPEIVSQPTEAREWVRLPVETGLLAVSIQWEGRNE